MAIPARAFRRDKSLPGPQIVVKDRQTPAGSRSSPPDKQPRWPVVAMVLTGALSLLAGALVVIGWHTGYILSSSVLRFQSVPVRYNVGLCFVFGGTALLLLARGMIAWGRAVAAPIATLGLLTLCEYLFNTTLGIDSLLFNTSRLAPSIGPRMAPNTAVCFMLLGGAFLLSGKARSALRNRLQAFVAALVTALGLVGFIGYLADIPTAYGWGGFTPMAVPTAALMAGLGLGVIAFAWRQHTADSAGLPPWSSLSVSLIVAAGSIALWQALHAQHPRQSLDILVLAVGVVQAALLYLVLHLLRTARERSRQLRQLNSALQLELAERERAEQSLRGSEQRYRALLIATAQVVWTTPPDGVVEDMPMWRQHTGQSLEEVRGWGWLNAIHPDDREPTAAVWKQAVATRGLYETEYRLRRADGQYRHFAIRGVPVLEDDGSIREWVGICTDIHERKQIEDELRKQAALLDLASDAILVRDLGGTILFWNRGAEETYGWKAKEATGRLIHELLRTECGMPTSAIEALVQQNGEWEGELRHVTREGRTIVVASRWSLQRDHHGVPSNILEINRDISEHKRVEDELRLNRERLLLAQKVGRSGTFDWDIRNNINTWSPEIEELYGLPAGEFTGTFEAWEALVWPSDLELARAAIAESLKTGEFQGEWRIIRPADHQLRWLAARAKVLRDENGQPARMIGINVDITERKQLEESLRQRTLELENSVAELEAFSYSVSHDLRAPLRSIDGFSQILLEDYRDKVDAEGQDCLRRVRNASQNMGQLIDALLQLSRVMRGELVREPVDLSLLALATAAVVQKAEPTRRVRFHIANSLQAQGDRRLLAVVLQNLLQNAWKFSAHNREPVIEFGSTRKDGKTAYYVRDNGIGFDMTYVDKLFTPFQRLHAQEQFEGTGIGLATVQRVIKRHGGRVWAEGAVGKGATFYFSLDYRRMSEQERQCKTQAYCWWKTTRTTKRSPSAR